VMAGVCRVTSGVWTTGNKVPRQSSPHPAPIPPPPIAPLRLQMPLLLHMTVAPVRAMVTGLFALDSPTNNIRPIRA